MCRHHETWIAGLRDHPVQEMKREVGDSLSDIAEGLELSKKLESLADGHWKECGHSGRLQLQAILQECSRKIVDETLRRRRELEGSGRVRFGSVALERSAGPDSPVPAAAPPRVGPAVEASHVQGAGRQSLSQHALALSPMNSERSPLRSLGQLLSSIASRPTPRGAR